MILPDINLLVYAYSEDAPSHAAARSWWEQLLSGTEPVGVAWAVSLGFVRLMSSRRVLASPMLPSEALGCVRDWMARGNVSVVVPGPRHLDLLDGLLDGPVHSSLVTDAHLAALAIENQGELHTNDSDFSRFSGLRWRNPLV